MSKTLIINRLYNLSYDQTEYQINDRISHALSWAGHTGRKNHRLHEDMLSASEAGKELFDVF
jgi:hypothetical protein